MNRTVRLDFEKDLEYLATARSHQHDRLADLAASGHGFTQPKRMHGDELSEAMMLHGDEATSG